MTVQVFFGRNVKVQPSHGSPEIMDGKFGVSAYITPGNVTTEVCPDPVTSAHPIARVVNNSASAVWASFGPAPNASTDPVRFLVPVGSDYHALVAVGDKASIVAA